MAIAPSSVARPGRLGGFRTLRFTVLLMTGLCLLLLWLQQHRPRSELRSVGNPPASPRAGSRADQVPPSAKPRDEWRNGRKVEAPTLDAATATALAVLGSADVGNRRRHRRDDEAMVRAAVDHAEASDTLRRAAEAAESGDEDPPPSPKEAAAILAELGRIQFTASKREDSHHDDDESSSARRLCVLLPTDGADGVHMDELFAALDAWGDANTVVYTTNASVAAAVASQPTLARSVVASGTSRWVAGHHRRILERPRLVKRGSTKKQLRGRGELSMPLFYWAWRERAGLLRHCAWFMKADTDSFVNRRQLMRQLSRLDSSEALYVGTRLNFDSRGFNYSQPSMRIKFNLGGPGYIFSRGLMERLDLDACFQNMALDPIWLIHDDVGTGYCATRFLKDGERPRTVAHHAAVAATSGKLLEEFLDDNTASHPCLACVSAIHPVSASRMRVIAERQEMNDAAGSDPAESCTSRKCGVTLIEGFRPSIGTAWETPRAVRVLLPKWPRSQLAEDLV
jgi:hypothetical protein